MRRAVRADKARPVDGEAHGQALDRHVVDHLVIAALQEGRVDGAERLHPVSSETGGEGYRVLLGDADVIDPLGEALGHQVNAGAGRHGGGDGDDAVVLLGALQELRPEHLGVGGGVGLGLGLLARDHVEADDAVILVGGVLGGGVALALLRDHVDQHGAVVDLADVLQHLDEVVHVVAVNGADIVEAELLEQGAAGGHAAGVLLGLARGFLQRAGEGVGDGAADAPDGLIGPPRHETGEIGAHAAHRGRDGHIIVVENDRELALGRLDGVVHRLIGHAGAHCSVADHRHDAVGAALMVAGGAEAQSRGDGGRGVRGAEGVVFALRALGEAGQALALAQGADAVAAPGEDLVRIGLVAHVPDQNIVRSFINCVQGDGQLHDAEARAQMAAGHGDGVDGLHPQFVRHLAQLGDGQVAQVGRRGDLIKKGSGRGHLASTGARRKEGDKGALAPI